MSGAEARASLFIANEWRQGASGRVSAVVNPATEELLAEVPVSDEADVDAAVGAARAALESDAWRGLSARRRGLLLMKAADLLEARRDEFARLETQQNGKTFFESRIEISLAAETLRYFGGWADKITGDTLPVNPRTLVYTLRAPVGVVAAIVPWNFPMNIASWKIAPALAAGCAVVLKPAAETPLTALAFCEIAREAGFPPGALNVVTGGAQTGAALVRHPGVDKISFTGSTEVGRGIMREAAALNKRVTLELGGKSPNIIFADADLEAAVKGALSGIFYSKGEVCAAGSRLLVERSVKEEVVARLAERAQKLTVGDPMEKTTRLGALVSRRQQERVLGYIETGKREGARVAAGGRAAAWNGKGFYVEATVFDAVTPEMTIAREEIFGPVVAVLPFEDEADAVRLANHTAYGLAAGIWTRDLGRAHRVARGIAAGTVWINTYNQYDAGAPFGGVKASGFGRDLGREALDAYLETKTVWVELGG